MQLYECRRRPQHDQLKQPVELKLPINYLNSGYVLSLTNSTFADSPVGRSESRSTMTHMLFMAAARESARAFLTTDQPKAIVRALAVIEMKPQSAACSTPSPKIRHCSAVYPHVFSDAIRVKIRDEGLVRNKAVCIALARANCPCRMRSRSTQQREKLTLH
jgi:hypothetical protein